MTNTVWYLTDRPRSFAREQCEEKQNLIGWENQKDQSSRLHEIAREKNHIESMATARLRYEPMEPSSGVKPFVG